jgi:ribosomal protein S27AE
MTQKSIFADDSPEPVNAVCPQCQGHEFMRLNGGENRYSCARCNWKLVIDQSGQRDMVDWMTAGSKRKRGRG